MCGVSGAQLIHTNQGSESGGLEREINAFLLRSSFWREESVVLGCHTTFCRARPGRPSPNRAPRRDCWQTTLYQDRAESAPQRHHEQLSKQGSAN
ncbi:hypothetical protein AAFF_G00299750 [Aldrovandia affinis]|uniref:Uncharacterized protein n=1 Tax=Aldrovandia affinis TaxID=143900 RepID=A0AAD7R8X5_9TELE|nr:hypothetical protein AAFF_G00299750 [Aldrovandia affinis]